MLIKKSFKINQHKTSISLEKEFWEALKIISKNENILITILLNKIDVERISLVLGDKKNVVPRNNFASSIRVFVLKYFVSH